MIEASHTLVAPADPAGHRVDPKGAAAEVRGEREQKAPERVGDGGDHEKARHGYLDPIWLPSQWIPESQIQPRSGFGKMSSGSSYCAPAGGMERVSTEIAPPAAATRKVSAWPAPPARRLTARLS